MEGEENAKENGSAENKDAAGEPKD